MSDSSKKSGKSLIAGFAAAIVGLAVIAVYILYVVLSGSPAASVLLLLLQILFVGSIVAGLAALLFRRWICGLVAIVCPLLLPLFDLVVRAIRGTPAF